MPSDPELDRVIEAMKREVEETIIEFVTEITALLTEKTPFETGHARFNWLPSWGAPIETVAGEVKEGKGGKRRSVGAKGEQKKLLDKILRYRLTDGDVFISNNVPYIVFLNYGTSEQAPRNYVQACVDQGIAIVNGRGGNAALMRE
jgi:hypothetical protein